MYNKFMPAMRRELFIHFCFWFSFFVLITLLKHYFNLSYWPFWVGGVVGLLLPDIDHLIYIYVIKPGDLSSQRVNYLLDKKDIFKSLEVMYETRSERKELVFHTIFFQIIFFVLTFWMMSSSGSYFGKGLVLSFALHLCVDQMMDINELGHFDNWFNYLPFKLEFEKSKIYWMAATILTAAIGLFM